MKGSGKTGGVTLFSLLTRVSCFLFMGQLAKNVSG